MADPIFKSFDEPDEEITFPELNGDVVEIGDFTVAKVTHEPGWRWSTHVRPIVGTEWCQAHHIGVVLSGGLGVSFPDGRTFELGLDDVFDIPPGHDGWTVGDEPLVQLEWSGIRTFVGARGGMGDRVLATLLFTDLVGSTETLARMGDSRWKELLARHYAAIRSLLERFGGREVDRTGDGLFALFDGPAGALQCAAAIRAATIRLGLHVRAGVHVGEVHIVGDDVKGLTVHEAARIMSAADADEILVSETTSALAASAGLSFEDRGTHTLKGLEGDRRLFAYVEA